MKIALCLSGQPRDVEACYPSIRDNLIIPNNIEDVFIHAWWRPEFETTGYSVGRIVPGNNNTTRMSKTVLNFLENNLKPKKYIVESDADKIFHLPSDIVSPKIDEGLFPNIFSMFYSRHLCNSLRIEYEKENNIEYDAIVFSRFDNYFRKQIKIDALDLNTLNSTDYINRIADKMYVNDVIMITNNEITNIYADIYHNLPLISKNLSHFFGEAILGKWFLMNNVTVSESIHYPGDIIIYRTINEMRQYHPEYWL